MGARCDKAQIVVAVEKHGAKGIKRVYIRKIDNASAAQLKVLTDKWKGYSPLAEHYDITQEKSQPDKNFKVMHRCIQQAKSWCTRGLSAGLPERILLRDQSVFAQRHHL